MWSEHEEDLDIFVEAENTDHGTKEGFISTTDHSLVLWLSLFILRLQSKHYLPDVAINHLLKFLYTMFSIIGRFSELAKCVAQSMPRSIHSLKRYAGVVSLFEKFTVCRKCNSIYNMKTCIERPGVSKACHFLEYTHSKRCNTLLLKTVELASKRRILYPYKVYCYQRVKDSLDRLFRQPNFADLCEHWKTRDVNVGILSDVYDGRMWKEYQYVSGKPFLASKFALAFSLNVDWFQPYKLTQSSVGVLYLTILNLPRHLRNTQQFTLLVGIIPGPDEPKRDINSYLKPLVQELLSLWDGELMRVHSFTEPQLVRGALICVACDLQASKKVAGFLGHTANLGCSRCLKVFPGKVGDKVYSGFNRALWLKRTNVSHRSSVASINKCSTKTERNRLESEYGCRYSELLKLEYFDPVRSVVIDPMHNLFLGSAKHLMKNIWLHNEQILSKDKFFKMQQFVDGFHVLQIVVEFPES